MHTTNLDITLADISKIEGHATVDIKVRDGKVEYCHFAIIEMRRFFMQAIRGVPYAAVPTKVSRICGTCSNAHLLASLKAIENALDIQVSDQTKLLRQLLNFALMIRDHALHLYIFVLPDLFHKDSLLAFDEHNETEHQFVHDCFDVKTVGNELAIAVGGRSVHAPNLKVGGFVKIPTVEELKNLIPKLQSIRPMILRLIDTYATCPFTLERPSKFVALTDESYSFLDGKIRTIDGFEIEDKEYRETLNSFFIPYSEATGYRFNNQTYMVGALARMNINKQALHPVTIKDIEKYLALFPSKNIYHNNLAQAIEILHSIDTSIDLIQKYTANSETPPTVTPKHANGIGIIEAPRGILYHAVEILETGLVKSGRVIVPTGQNQVDIEESLKDYINSNMDKPKAEIELEIEKIIRAYDPCMSCASHFLKVKWK